MSCDNTQAELDCPTSGHRAFFFFLFVEASGGWGGGVGARPVTIISFIWSRVDSKVERKRKIPEKDYLDQNYKVSHGAPTSVGRFVEIWAAVCIFG